MNKTAIFLLSAWMLIASACSWVDDDYSNCPDGTWLKIIYSYNLLDVDAAATQVNDVTLFIMDEQGNLVGQKEVGSLELQQNQYRVRLPELPNGDYSILVWGGLADNHYSYTPTNLTLSQNAEGEQSDQLASLFHGRLNHITIDQSYQVYEVSLTKDTNVFSCILQCRSNKSLNEEDFRMELVAQNSVMDHWNTPLATEQPVTYLPYMTGVADLEDYQTLLMGMNTLRLMEGDNTRLKLIYTPEEKELFDIPLTNYLLLSRMVDYGSMPAQEYLDRQDRYDLIFFLREVNNSYSCIEMQVNSWIVRFSEIHLGEE